MAITRETKLGMGVSLTFVCLVGLILGCGLYEEQPEEQQAVEGPTQVAANPPPVSPPPGPLPAGLVPVKNEEQTPTVTRPTPTPITPAWTPTLPPTVPTVPQPVAPVGPTQLEPMTTVPPPPPPPPAPDVKVGLGEDEKENDRLKAVALSGLIGVPAVVASPSGIGGLLARIEPMPAPLTGPGIPLPPLASEQKEPVTLPAPPPPTTDVKPPLIGGPVPLPPPMPVTPPLADYTNPPPPTTIPAPVGSPASATLGAPMESKFVRAPEEPTPAPVGGPIPPAPAGTGTMPPESRLVPTAGNNAGAAPVPPTGLNPIPATPAPTETKAPIIPAPVSTPLPAPATGRKDSPGGNLLAPVPTTPPPPSSGAQVTSHPYRMVKVEKDASFQELSGWYYKSDKYAPDLAKFNRDNGGPVESAAGKIAAPQTVYFPDVVYFEKPQAPATEPRPVAVNARPMGKMYTAYEVPPGGESWLTIAQGRADRAEEIKNLNPTAAVNTQGVVPAGTLLKLPADVQATNTPR